MLIWCDAVLYPPSKAWPFGETPRATRLWAWGVWVHDWLMSGDCSDCGDLEADSQCARGIRTDGERGVSIAGEYKMAKPPDSMLSCIELPAWS